MNLNPFTHPFIHPSIYTIYPFIHPFILSINIVIHTSIRPSILIAIHTYIYNQSIDTDSMLEQRCWIRNQMDASFHRPFWTQNELSYLRIITFNLLLSTAVIVATLSQTTPSRRQQTNRPDIYLQSSTYYCYCPSLLSPVSSSMINTITLSSSSSSHYLSSTLAWHRWGTCCTSLFKSVEWVVR